AGAIQLPFNSTLCTNLCGTYFSSAGATSSGATACTGNNDDDVWFWFRAVDTSTTTAGTIKVKCAGGYDAVIELLDSTFTSIDCKNSTGQGSIETLTKNLVNGKKYYVRVYDANNNYGINGAFSICISKTPPAPANDNCAGAINLGVNLSLVAVNGTNTTAATESSGVPVPCNGTIADDDVWYSFVSPEVTATITVNGDIGFNPAVQAFSGNCNSLTTLQ